MRCFIFLGCLGVAFAQPPPTPKRPVVDTYHGVRVKDDYRWLENNSDPAVKAWSDAQNTAARRFLDAIPARTALFAQLSELHHQPAPFWSSLSYRSGMLFALKTQPPKEQPILVELRSAEDPGSEKAILDPNLLDAKGGAEIDFYVPSRDGKRVAVSISRGGSENGDVHVYDVATGKALPDFIPRVNGGTAGGSLAWNADSTGFYYTRYPRQGERPPADLDFYQQVWFHKLGTAPSQDTYSLGKDFPRIAEILLSTSEDGRYVLAQMENGDGGVYALYMVPGMGHCGGGEGTDHFDLFPALQTWVEHNKAPGQIIASRIEDGRTIRTRPLCAYPEIATYKGSGSTDDAASFTCKKP